MGPPLLLTARRRGMTDSERDQIFDEWIERL
jgi:hypothetical protein